MFKCDSIFRFPRHSGAMKARDYGISLSVLAGLAVACMAAQSPKPATPLPAFADASGMYSFEREGEFVQITIEQPAPEREAKKPLAVTGFISRYADTESDRGAFLDYFISNGALDGDKLAFTTKPVHGIFYEFKGTIARGAAPTKDKDGYYELRGTLTQDLVTPDKNAAPRSREITMRLYPDIDNDSPRK
jgi:hypothetical protein